VAIARSWGSPEEIQRIQFGAFLHDIGKVHTQDEVLHKPGALTEEEWLLVKAHPVRRGDDPGRAPPARHGHRPPPRARGRKVPDGLRGDEITLAARS
jgi:HD-GYP domain-containing protein (c-di-GMP phosphodiesterase class II)